MLGPVFTQAPASGIHEVVVLSPDHQRAWADLDDRQIALVMAAIRDRVEDHGRHAVVRHSLVIVNHDPTPLDGAATLVIPAAIGPTLRAVDALLKR